MIVDIFLKIAQNVPLSQSEMEELSSYISASHTTTAKITNMREIGELGYDLGEVWAGRFIASADPNNNDVASSAFTGTYMDADGVTGKNAGTTQFQLSSTDGKATAGAGAVTLDENGITFELDDGTLISRKSIKFGSDDDLVINGGVLETGATNINIMVGEQQVAGRTYSITLYAKDSSANIGTFIFRPLSIDYKINGQTQVQFGPSNVINYSGADVDTIIKGDTDTNLFVADAGLDAIGMGGAAESGKKLKVTGDVHITGAVTLDGNVTLGDAAADTLTFTGTPAGQIVSGTYTPTLTNTTNVAASTARVCQYMRVGSVVTVSGSVNIDPTATGSTVLTMSLPIASNFANTYELGGSGAPDITTPIPVVIRGSSTADAAIFVFNATSTAAQEVYFTFTYRII